MTMHRFMKWNYAQYPSVDSWIIKCTKSEAILRKMITLSLCNLMVLELAYLVKDFCFRLNYFLGAPDWIEWNSVGEVILSRTVVLVNFQSFMLFWISFPQLKPSFSKKDILYLERCVYGMGMIFLFCSKDIKELQFDFSLFWMHASVRSKDMLPQRCLYG